MSSTRIRACATRPCKAANSGFSPTSIASTPRIPRGSRSTSTCANRSRRGWARTAPSGSSRRACAQKDPKAFARAPAGTGAFAFERRDADRRILLKRFDASVAFEQIELRVVADETSRILELLKGRADVLTVTPSRPLLAPLQRRDELELISAPGNGYSYLAFNLRLPELSDVRIRRAVALAIDRAAIIEHKYLGLARRALR